MSETTLRQINDRNREAASTVAWRQWAALGSSAASQTTARSMIDPEALVLITLSLSSYERRFWGVLADWSAVGAKLLSVQRLRNLARSYPESILGLVAKYARFVCTEVGDQRWKSLQGGDTAHEHVVRRVRWDGEIDLLNEPALMLRLRRGFGVNLRTDILSYLMAIRGEAVSVKQLTETLGFSNAATRRAAADLAQAHLIAVSGRTKPETYAVDPKVWARVLGLKSPPPRWRRWNEVFEFVATVGEWEISARDSRIAPYALETLGNELTEKYHRIFEASERTDNHGRRRVSERRADSFEDRTLGLCDWMVKNA